MTPQQHDFLEKAFQAAKAANHIFPEMAACEAALESGYGRSQLATQDKNLFGMKAHTHPDHPDWGEVSLPTHEFIKGVWIAVNANWMRYDELADCFEDRMATLRRLATIYPHYQNALTAGASTTYIYEVSKTWSTDPERAEKVLAIYEAVAGDWNAT